MILVSGGAGFIGSNFVLKSVLEKKLKVINLDKLTYAGNIKNLNSLEHNPLHHFIQGDIGDRVLVRELLQNYSPDWVIHFAAETHVDRSIDNPERFLNTNVTASFNFLEEVFCYWKQLESSKSRNFRFLNVSTDEVYGSLSVTDPPSNEKSPFAPNNPYAASKASFDHFVRAFNRTYGFPSISTYCSNNFGPHQFPEKLIPLTILNALQGTFLPVYGNGQQIRQWLYVVDHCEALFRILEQGMPGSIYNIGSNTECTNLSLVKQICRLLDELKSDSPFCPHDSLIKHVEDRPGHDFRYSLDSSKLTLELGWKPDESFDIQLKNTVKWYMSLGHKNY